MKQKLTLLLSVLCLFVLLTACGGQEEVPAEENVSLVTQEIPAPPKAGEDITPTDYSDPAHWMNIPEIEYEVDVFFLYPTAWSREEGDLYYCEIDNASMLTGTVYMREAQASVFEEVGNLFAPYYRQVDAPFILDLPMEDRFDYFAGVPYTDVVAAFEYYLEHYNQGRPFILAGHSQGSCMLKMLLMEYMEAHPDVYDRMVAAYVIGYGVTQQELDENPHLKFAEGADDTGVIISWNTEAPGLEYQNPVAPPGSISINPITWTRTEETASADQNLGSRLVNRATGEVTEMDGLADATVNLERGTVICTADPELYGAPNKELFPEGNFHTQEYAFFYYNIQENAALRAANFLAAQ